MFKISIIIPIYNLEQFLSKALESCINQTYKNIEIICINDGSTDNSLNLLKEFKNKVQNLEIKKNEDSDFSERNVKVLDSTFTAAKKHIEETAFQRKELRAWLDKEYLNLIKVESFEN